MTWHAQCAAVVEGPLASKRRVSSLFAERDEGVAPSVASKRDLDGRHDRRRDDTNREERIDDQDVDQEDLDEDDPEELPPRRQDCASGAPSGKRLVSSRRDARRGGKPSDHAGVTHE
jgi:hypothetical protein